MRRFFSGVLAWVAIAAAPILGGAAASASAAASLPPALVTSAATPFGYRVRVPIGEAVVVHGDVEGVPLDEVLLPGGADTAPDGAPQIPTRTVWLRVPWGVEPHVRATPGTTRPLGAIRPTPVPKLVTEPSERAGQRTRDWREALASPAYAAAPPADLIRRVTPMAVGGTRILAVELAPVQWEPATGSAWQFEDVVLDVSWERPVEALAPGAGSTPRASARAVALEPDAAAGPRYAMRSSSPAPRATAAGGPLRVDPSRPWVRLATTRTGLYRVTAADLATAGVAVGSIDPATLRIFRASPGDLPESVDVDLVPDSLRECAIEVKGEGDGSFDPADTLYFYGTGAFGFGFDLKRGGGEEFKEALRTFEAPYWLTWGSGPPVTAPLRVPGRDAALVSGSAPLLTTDVHRLHIGANRLYQINLFLPGYTWERWFDRIIVEGNRIAYPLSLPGAVPGSAASLRLRLWGFNSSIGTSIPDHIARVTWNRALVDSAGWNFSLPQDLTGGGFAVGQSIRDTLEVGVPLINDPSDPNRSDAQYIAWFDVDYSRRLQATADTLFFAAPDSVAAGRFRYAVSAVSDSAAVRCYDRTDPDRPVRLFGGAWSGAPGAFTLTLEDSAGPGYRPRYALLSTTRALRPSAIALYAPPMGARTVSDLLDTANQADYIVVAPPAFLAAAESLATDRSRFLSGEANPIARVATTDRIFSQFAGGTPDVAALRNFLAYATRHWARPPLYVCLLGDASLDPLNYSGLRVIDQVPTYSRGHHTELQEQYSIEDWIVRLDGPGDQLLDLAIGRLPARTPEEALEMVRGKRRIYESNTSFDLARNRALLCADDAWKWSKPQQLDPVGLDHVRQMERKDRFHLPFPITREKVYLNDYAFSDSFKTSKPGAREAFIAAVNRQNWLVDYIGHGTDNFLADEQVFRSTDATRLTNTSFPAIWCFMSCTVGRFDEYRSGADGLAEILVRAPTVGAVAAVAATGEVFGTESSELNDRFVDQLFPLAPRVDSLTTVGLAWARAKNQSVNISARKYALLGEPGTLPPLPRGRGVWEKGALDSVLRGEQVTLRGHAINEDGSADTLAAGRARLRILGPPSRRIQTGSNGGNPGIAPYDLPGPLLYQGEVSLAAGTFAIQFTVPVDARVSGPGARLEALLEQAGGEGVGLAVDSLRIGQGLSPRIDVTPPTITLVAPPDTTYSPGDQVTIAIEDSSGIDLTGFDNAHAVFVLFDDAGTPINLTSAFVYQVGSGTRGSVILTLPPLATGPHRMEVHASDTYRNIGVASFVIEVAASAGGGGPLQLSQVFNYPNPFEKETYVHVRLSQPARLKVQILTVAGRRVREWSADGKAGENYLPWDGRDSGGENVAIGVYLIHVTAEAAGSGRVDAVGRALRTR